MRTSLTEIGHIVNPVKFQKIQDDMARATELAIITVDYLGRPLTKHSNCSEFCDKVRSSNHGIYCEKCDSHGGLEAARNRKPFLYICHAGLVDFAIPIIVNDLYIGAFMAGQVLLSEPDSGIERILHNVSNTINPTMDDYFKKSYDKLPKMQFIKIKALANMLLHIGNYCVEVAQLKDIISSSMQPTSEIYNDIEHLISNEYSPFKTIQKQFRNESSIIIQPALMYIKKHTKEKITLAKMATLCNISPSYFSKLFAKENLGNLSDYVNQIKIDHAKKLLYETDWPIRTIADDLGFEDGGYFIKVFKKITNKTPLEYRNERIANSI